MRVFVGTVFVLLGAWCIGYVFGDAAVFERDPPLVAIGAFLVATGVGLALGSRAARLAAGAGAGLLLLVVAAGAFEALGDLRSLDTTDGLIALFHLFGYALAAAALVITFLFLRRVRTAPTFGRLDLLPLAGLIVGLVLGVVWLVGDGGRLRPCRMGNAAACDGLARGLLESAERGRTSRPSGFEERTAQALEEHGCRGPEPGPCAVALYAAGTVAARAGRADAARSAFLRACEAESGWCARAVQERSVSWTPEQREQLTRHQRR